MGYLNNSTITVDAILTKKGRELLARGNQLQITKFAVADDEIDYSLYDLAHPLGTAYYGSAIENMPVLEASPDETQNMRYKLVTLPRGQTANIPKLNVETSTIIMTYSSRNIVDIVRRVDTNGNYDDAAGYTALLFDNTIADIFGDNATITGTLPRFAGDVLTSSAKVVTSLKEFRLVPKAVTQTRSTQLVIIGNESGATVSIPVTVNPELSQ